MPRRLVDHPQFLPLDIPCLAVAALRGQPPERLYRALGLVVIELALYGRLTAEDSERITRLLGTTDQPIDRAA